VSHDKHVHNTNCAPVVTSSFRDVAPHHRIFQLGFCLQILLRKVCNHFTLSRPTILKLLFEERLLPVIKLPEREAKHKALYLRVNLERSLSCETYVMELRHGGNSVTRNIIFKTSDMSRKMSVHS
jgi:hypothetical protein